MNEAVTCLEDYDAFVERARIALQAAEPIARLEVVGSLARREARPPHSDIDLMLVAPAGRGPALRDRVPEIAGDAGRLLTIFVDPFSWQGCFCSVYANLLKVDWFVSEPDADGQRMVWSGNDAPPYDPVGHVWDWTWWIWGKIRTGKVDLAATELSKLWLFLVQRGSSRVAFPHTVPDPAKDDLAALVLSTMKHLPRGAIAILVEEAIRSESDSR